MKFNNFLLYKIFFSDTDLFVELRVHDITAVPTIRQLKNSIKFLILNRFRIHLSKSYAGSGFKITFFKVCCQFSYKTSLFSGIDSRIHYHVICIYAITFRNISRFQGNSVFSFR
jgi:hypothetical protein